MATTAITALPLLGLRITAGPVELRGITDDLLAPLADLAIAGIHDPDYMPFYTPWSLTPPPDMPRAIAQYHWRNRAEFSPEKWTADLAVFWEGELAGSQGIGTRDYLTTRTGETGSWLGRRFQGRGIGTAMRQVMCAFAFDHLDAELVTSGAFTDNRASLAVSKKAGYEEQGWRRVVRLGEAATIQGLVLTPGKFNRYQHALAVEGLAPFRRSIGLDLPASSPVLAPLAAATRSYSPMTPPPPLAASTWPTRSSWSRCSPGDWPCNAGRGPRTEITGGHRAARRQNGRRGQSIPLHWAAGN
jgi:RimJ/RimL family protein N-acetyltransferase